MSDSRSIADPLTPAAAAASALLVAIGLIVLAGWMFDLDVLKGLWGGITMKANSAAAFVACGLALWLWTSPSASVRAGGEMCALLVMALGLATLSEHLLGWNLGIDELLFREAPGAVATVSPNRMGPNASTNFTLGGLALWQLYRSHRGSLVVAQVAAAIIALLALIPVVGYLYGAAQLYAIARLTGIAFHTGLAFLVLSVGILAARPYAGPFAALTGPLPHAAMARRLLFVAIALPLVLGYIRIMGERLGWYDSAFGASVMVVVTIAMLSLTIWRAALAQARSEEERTRVQQHRDDLLLSERAARERAELADRAKDEFIAALSHELRTPLNAILGWMQMLQQGALPEDRRAKAREAVTRNAGLLSRLIEDLLDTSRITTGRLELSKAPLDINAVVLAAAESVLPAADAKDVVVVVSPDAGAPPLRGDGQRLQQVVWNLLSNAIKFSPPGARVILDVRADAGAVTVCVTDEGEGIDPDFLPHVFDRFRRHDTSTERGTGGLGLGLYIAKHLTELHGGTIQAASAGSGRGATFTVRLPVEAAAQDRRLA